MLSKAPATLTKLTAFIKMCYSYTILQHLNTRNQCKFQAKGHVTNVLNHHIDRISTSKKKTKQQKLIYGKKPKTVEKY